MTIYRLWLISLKDKQILYTKYFPHLERIDNFEFPPLTSDEFLKCLFISLGLNYSTEIRTKSKDLINPTLSSTFGEHDDDGKSFSTSYSRERRSSTSSSISSHSSLSSYMSNMTINSTMLPSLSSSSTSSTAKQSSSSSSIMNDNQIKLSNSIILKENLCLYNHLPLLICPLINLQNNNAIINNRKSMNLLINYLIMMIYEQNGYLFVCLPRIDKNLREELSNQMNQQSKSLSLCNINDRLLMKETNVTLSYTILNMLSSAYFQQNKSLKSLESFIMNHLPFGTLIKTNHQQPESLLQVQQSKQTKPKPSLIIRLVETLSTSFRTIDDHQSSADAPMKPNLIKEKIFGTLDIKYRYNDRSSSRSSTIIANIDNLSTLTLVLPSNCHVSNDQPLQQQSSSSSSSSAIIYNCKNMNDNSRLNLIHYKSIDDFKANVSTGGGVGYSRNKFFNVKYLIYQNKPTNNTNNQQQPKSFTIESKNLHHLCLQIQFNAPMRSSLNNQLKYFRYFQIKFQLNQQQQQSSSNNSSQSRINNVQTTSNSINNLIIRNSLKVNYGKLKFAEQNALCWQCDLSKMNNTNSPMISINFDLIITKDNLKFLDTQLSFDYLVKIPLSLRPNRADNQKIFETTQLINQSSSSSSIIEPYLKFTKISLINPRMADESTTSASANDNIIGQLEYEMNSFEYRLWPTIDSGV